MNRAAARRNTNSGYNVFQTAGGRRTSASGSRISGS